MRDLQSAKMLIECFQDPEHAAEELEIQGYAYHIARQAIYQVFGYDYLGR